MSDCDPMDPSRLLCPWSSPGKNAGVGGHSLLQEIFPGIEHGSPALQADSLPYEPPGKPILACQDLKLKFQLTKEGKREREKTGM